MNSNEKETIEIQYQSISGTWQTASVIHDSSDASIFNAMKNLERQIEHRSARTVTGRMRAKGKKTGRIYDMR